MSSYVYLTVNKETDPKQADTIIKVLDKHEFDSIEDYIDADGNREAKYSFGNNWDVSWAQLQGALDKAIPGVEMELLDWDEDEPGMMVLGVDL